MNDDLAWHDVSLAEGFAAVLLRIVLNICAALYRPGVERQVLLTTDFVVKTIEDTCGFKNCTGANLVRKNS